MLEVRLNNPSLILTPISDVEQETMDDESMYVLYKLPESEDINVGMMSSSMRKYFPATANIWYLDRATALAFFHNGGRSLEESASRITDRPVYKIYPTDNRKVGAYSIINGTEENGLDIPLEDVVNGNYPNKNKVFIKDKKQD